MPMVHQKRLLFPLFLPGGCFFLVFFLILQTNSEKTMAQTPANQHNQPDVFPFYIGTYTESGFPGKGVYRATLDAKTGALSSPELVFECRAPAFLIRHPQKPVLYAVGETWDPDKGPVYAFRIAPETGHLTQISEITVSGTGPTHLCIDSRWDGEALIVACYGSGNVVALPILPDGSLGEQTCSVKHVGSGPNPSRQQEPHPHGAYSAENLIFIPDLGMDKVMMYRLDHQTGTLSPNQQPFIAMPPGSGPRHLAFSPREIWKNGAKTIYVVNELNSTVCRVVADDKGCFEVVQTVSTLPEGKKDAAKPSDEQKNWTAEIVVHPSGRFVYVSNRGDDSIAVFQVDQTSGTLRFLETEPTRGKTPRNIAISPDGAFLLAANQDSNSVFCFRIDSESGRLHPLGDGIEVGAAVCITFE